MRSAFLCAVLASSLLGVGAAHAAEGGSSTGDADAGFAELQLGLEAVADGDSRAAAHHFDRAAALDPELAVLALYNAGVAYEQAGDRTRAAERARQVLGLDPHPRASKSAQALLQRVESWRPWSADGTFGLLYDDNVSQNEIDLNSGRDDGAGLIELGGSYRFLDDSRHRLETGYDFYQTAYFHESDFNLQSHGFALSGSRAVGPVEAVLDYRYSLATLGGDFFLGFHQISPSLEFAPLTGLYGVVGPRVVDKSFDDPRRDALQSGFATDAYFFPQVLSEQVPSGSFATLGLGFQSEDAEGAEFDYTGFGLRSGIHLPFPIAGTEHALDFTYHYRLRDYDNVTPSIGVARLDAVHGTRLRLSRKLGSIAQLRLDYEFTRSQSNLPAVDYDQNAVGVSLGFSL